VLNRRLASLVAAVSVAGLVATGCGNQSAAIRVGDDSLSRSEFEDNLDFVYENDDFRAWLFQSDSVAREQLRGEDDPSGSYTQEYVGAMAGVQVELLLIAQVLDDVGLEVTDEDRADAASDVEEWLEGDADSLPDWVRDTYLDGIAAREVLLSDLGESELNQVLGDLVADADIDVSSRYGTWDPDEFRVTPPGGPAPAPDDAPAQADFGVGGG
jgi:hypothetical protein